ncbi:hypothetical protein GYMLUDRAFT_40829 [Collybiopsis luxurians FD-317 M1]|uniref:Uncharacterized protein n=1 Tax=Collybiopsis luxurians FD-317 M1 TaxID=944289 RepID=A0A0D0CLA7_9AGAR|nr:hypothetical protein GYMLUDRAFT_40829 [Collybiopsis luxurians FD-317 M1]
MPRRGPPSPLRLAQGPTPARSVPKHTMPSVPRPVFTPPMIVSRGANARPRVSTLQVDVVMEEIKSCYGPVGDQSQGSILETARELRIRGPWDHSGSISAQLERGRVLAPLKAAVVV